MWGEHLREYLTPVGWDIPCHLKCPPWRYLLSLTGVCVWKSQYKMIDIFRARCSEVGSCSISLLSIRFTLVKCIMYYREHYTYVVPVQKSHILDTQSRSGIRQLHFMIFTQTRPNCTFHHNRKYKYQPH